MALGRLDELNYLKNMFFAHYEAVETVSNTDCAPLVGFAVKRAAYQQRTFAWLQLSIWAVTR